MEYSVRYDDSPDVHFLLTVIEKYYQALEMDDEEIGEMRHDQVTRMLNGLLK